MYELFIFDIKQVLMSKNTIYLKYTKLFLSLSIETQLDTLYKILNV
jgi:hypothetical protein